MLTDIDSETWESTFGAKKYVNRSHLFGWQAHQTEDLSYFDLSANGIIHTNLPNRKNRSRKSTEYSGRYQKLETLDSSGHAAGLVTQMKENRRNQIAEKFTIPAVDEVSIAPDPGGVAHAFARIGYKIEESLADLVDNSIDADSRTVLIRFYRSNNSLERVVIVDDGHGLTADRLDVAMQFGGKSDHSPDDLGKFGMGLKSASLSQCRSLSLLTRAGESVSGRRWTADSIERDWMCEKLHGGGVGAFLAQDWDPVKCDKHGTIVIWDELEHLGPSSHNIERLLAKIFRQISHHLGLIFHRFLDNGDFQIFIDSFNIDTDLLGPREQVVPLDPFGYHRSGMEGYPKNFRVQEDSLPPLVFEAHIWPGQSAEAGYKLGGGKVASRQGMYFYRNGRLIQAGGWSGIREHDSEPHTSLARVKVDLPPELDNEYLISVQKSKVDVPPSLRMALSTAKSNGVSFGQYIQDANDTYRGTVESPGAPIIVGRGIPAKVRKEIRRAFADKQKDVRSVAFVWKKMPNEFLFQIDSETNVINLNSRYRKQLTSSDNKGVMAKSLMFVLLRDEFDRKVTRAAHLEEMKNLNRILISALEL